MLTSIPSDSNFESVLTLRYAGPTTTRTIPTTLSPLATASPATLRRGASTMVLRMLPGLALEAPLRLLGLVPRPRPLPPLRPSLPLLLPRLLLPSSLMTPAPAPVPPRKMMAKKPKRPLLPSRPALELAVVDVAVASGGVLTTVETTGRSTATAARRSVSKLVHSMNIKQGR